MTFLRFPDEQGRVALLAGLVAFSMTALARSPHAPLVAVAACVSLSVALVGSGRTRWLACLGLLAVATGVLSSQRELAVAEAPIPVGSITVVGVAINDGRISQNGSWVLLQPERLETPSGSHPWMGPTILVAGHADEVTAKSRIAVSGSLRAVAGTGRGQNYAGVLDAIRVTTRDGGGGIFLVADLARSRVAAMLDPWSNESAGGLVAGFLIGDTSGIAKLDQSMLRDAGLSHYVAVSGSNVALFLGLWWVIAAPLAFGPRRRAIGGLAGVAIFIALTRWEPSVVRAGVMAVLVLGARAIGYPLSTWSALGGAVTGVVLVAPELVDSVGFQLSIAATLGVLAFQGMNPTPWKWLNAALSATSGAQLAVAPVLLWHFGTIPLMAPFANILAAPAVTLATMAGGVGVVLGVEPLLAVSVLASRYVLAVAETAADWPQLTALGFLGVLALVGMMLAQRTRWLGVLLAGGALIVHLLGPTTIARPSVVVLDVGQGDAILLMGEHSTVLFDGGSDPELIVSKLRQYAVESIDLLVITHPHEDHQGGLVAVVERWPIGQIWHSGWPEAGGSFTDIEERAEEKDINVAVPPLGSYYIGGWELEVLGPRRRYVDANDQSVVILATFGGVSVLLTGDAELYAQREIGEVEADILKVPHHGGATSNLAWLAATNAQIAIISYGENSFGHPSEEVLLALTSAGMEVRETGAEGDVVIPLEPSLGTDGG